MARPDLQRYRSRLAVAMVLYISLLLVGYPASRTATELPMKVSLALLPALPMCYVIWLMAARIRASDEFEQRIHLVALGAATAVVAAGSLIAGFLAAAQVPGVGASLLLWVFPLLMGIYSAVRWWVTTRHYGGTMACERDEFPWRQRLAMLGAVCAIILLHVLWVGRFESFDLGLLAGMGGATLVWALSGWLARRREKRLPAD